MSSRQCASNRVVRANLAAQKRHGPSACVATLHSFPSLSALDLAICAQAPHWRERLAGTVAIHRRSARVETRACFVAADDASGCVGHPPRGRRRWLGGRNATSWWGSGKCGGRGSAAGAASRPDISKHTSIRKKKLLPFLISSSRPGKNIFNSQWRVSRRPTTAFFTLFHVREQILFTHFPIFLVARILFVTHRSRVEILL